MIYSKNQSTQNLYNGGIILSPEWVIKNQCLFHVCPKDELNRIVGIFHNDIITWRLGNNRDEMCGCGEKIPDQVRLAFLLEYKL